MVFFALALIYFIRLRPFGDPTGADGYFYLKQIQSLSEHGAFYYRDHSLAFLPPALLNLIVRDPLFAFSISTLFTFGAIGWISARLARRVSGRAGAAMEAGDWVYLAAALLYYAYGNLFLELNLVFLKTATAVFFLLHSWERVLAGRRKSAAASALGALLSHKLMFVLVPLAVLALWPRRFLVVAFSGTVVVVLAVLAQPALLAHFKFLAGEIDFTAYSTEPFSRMPTAAAFGVLALFAGGVAIALGRRARALSAPTTAFFYFAAGILFLSALYPSALNTESARYRVELVGVAFFPVVFGGALLIGGLWRGVGITLAAIPIALGLYFNRPLSSWITPWSERITGTERIATRLPVNALLYAPHGVEFYLAYRTPFRPRSLRIEAEGREVYRAAYVAPYLREEGLLKNDLETSAVLNLGKEFAIYREEDWLALNRIHLFIPHPMNLLPKKPDFVSGYD